MFSFTRYIFSFAIIGHFSFVHSSLLSFKNFFRGGSGALLRLKNKPSVAASGKLANEVAELRKLRARSANGEFIVQ